MQRQLATDVRRMPDGAARHALHEPPAPRGVFLSATARRADPTTAPSPTNPARDLPPTRPPPPSPPPPPGRPTAADVDAHGKVGAWGRSGAARVGRRDVTRCDLMTSRWRLGGGRPAARLAHFCCERGARRAAAARRRRADPPARCPVTQCRPDGRTVNPARRAVTDRRCWRARRAQFMWTAENGCRQRAVSAETMEGYIKVQRPGELHSDETLARYAPGKRRTTNTSRCALVAKARLCRLSWTCAVIFRLDMLDFVILRNNNPNSV